MKQPKFSTKMLLPKYWLTWIGFGIWWLLAQLPYSIQLLMGRGVGQLMKKFAKRRTAIAKRNIELCFSHLSAKEQEDLFHRQIDSLGIGFFEIGIAWFWSRKRLQKLVTYEGLEHLKNAEAEGVGVILMGMHFTHLDCGAMFMNMQHSIDGSYRPHSNPVYNWIQHNRRARFSESSTVIERSDVRTMVRQLRNGRAVWYAPDQDYRSKHSIFIPFFGVQANYITATTQLAKMGKACVIPFTCIRKKTGGYQLKVYPALENFPSDDLVKDTQQINQVVENAILLAPEQYLWVHRRFKTRPQGETDLYRTAGIAKGKRDRPD